VTVPLQTPLGETSHLHFTAVSRGDSSVVTSADVTPTTVVQRGDPDFNGVIDIGDLTYLVDYLFTFGPDPQPVIEAGNFDCLGSVDISDLTAIAEYLFSSGSAPPCNPY
jgi:hypothetical protein